MKNIYDLVNCEDEIMLQAHNSETHITRCIARFPVYTGDNEPLLTPENILQSRAYKEASILKEILEGRILIVPYDGTLFTHTIIHKNKDGTDKDFAHADGRIHGDIEEAMFSLFKE